MNKWKRLFTSRPVSPEQRENVKVIYVTAKLVPDTADSFVPRKNPPTLQVSSTITKSGVGGKQSLLDFYIVFSQ